MTSIVIDERGPENGAFAPDLPGYEATAAPLDELRGFVRAGNPLHIEGVCRAGEPAREPIAIA